MEPTTIIILSIRYGYPLLKKLVAGAWEEDAATAIVSDVITALAIVDEDGIGILKSTDKQQVSNIVDALCDLVNDAKGAVEGLLKAFGGK